MNAFEASFFSTYLSYN